MIIGVISDTHSLVRPEALEYLAGSDIIVHAGDIGSDYVIRDLQAVCPVVAIRGNIDRGSFGDQFPKTEVVEADEKLIYMIHNIDEIDLDPVAAGFDVVVFGHSHMPSSKIREGVLYFNPGSAGPRRFKLPVALGKLYISKSGIAHETHLIA
ncbi:hypothetical protein SAMN05216326_1235 [Nitrosomonas marina]|uniref:Phosphoesterase n=1 Tax=Nitrosomonas marina TaxID=917 RepID=A0A1I0DW52_9PROT|nr:metallophosphoesterase family protein [Nitrosomonas marina]SET36579.1 hypothetical protein SAMN05216326_1235 [Nitrosomonas marina]